MKNKKITRKITQGVYTLTTKGGGCIVDAVSQISAGDNPLISVAVMKTNNTNKLIKESGKFALSVVGLENNPEIIKIFGMNSSRDINKFEGLEVEEIDGINVIKDSLGYMICEVVDSIENDTHTLFIGKLIEADMYEDKNPMSYAHYMEHKDELLKIKTEKGKTAWVCKVCGYVHYAEELEDDFVCPMCFVPKTLFEKKED